jgi:replicative DNA helicase
MNQTDLKFAKLLMDPVAWSEAYLRNPEDPSEPLKLRWFQKEVIACRSRKKSVRASRRIGKSVALCVDIVWKGFVHKNKIILVITPYQAQVDHLFDIIEKLVQDSPAVKASIKNIRRAPQYKIEFKNGSIVKGFTAGSRSGQKGEGIRGQDGTDIYLDEVDYMGPGAIEAVRAIELSRARVEVWASSTPTGKREHFYRWCRPHLKDKNFNELGFTTFHYPVTVHPNWGPALEKEFRADVDSELTFLREYMAEFGDEAFGIFNQEKLDKATRDYRYYDWNDGLGKSHMGCIRQWNPANIYTMGVDWNSESVGTRMVVLEHIADHTSKDFGKFRVFLSETLTLGPLQAIDRVIQTTKGFQVAHSYLDHGFGHTNYEIIRKQTADQPMMADVFKTVRFDGKITTRDPIDGIKIEKEIKPFMVNSLARLVDDDLLILPAFEDENKGGLIRQMREYTIKRIGASGRPIYTDDNEDSLIALMLAFHAFVENYSDLVRTILETTVLIDPNFVVAGDIQDRSFEPEEEQNKRVGKPREPAFQKLVAKMGMDYNYRNWGPSMDIDEEEYLTALGKGERNRWARPGSPTRTNVSGKGRSNF